MPASEGERWTGHWRHLARKNPRAGGLCPIGVSGHCPLLARWGGFCSLQHRGKGTEGTARGTGLDYQGIRLILSPIRIF
jgi:hypothetical protein